MAKQTLSRQRPLVLLLLFSLALFLWGCAGEKEGQQHPEATVRLDRLITLPEPTWEQEDETIRLAVAAILSPQGTVNSYRPLQAYMEQHFGKPVILVQRRTYQEVNELLARELVDVAFVCTGPFITGQREGIMEMLVVPQISGKLTYHGQFIVLASSPYFTVHDLRGKSFAFTDPMSNTGYRYPMGVIQAQGASAEQFFSQIIFSYSHDRSITAVLDGVVDGASVDRIVYDHALRRDPALEDRFRVIHRSQEYGIPPVVVPPRLGEERKRLLRNFFLNIHRDPIGAEVLAKLGIERFVAGDIDLYN
ncbi:MAG: phosphate/phosphite/phosphonate ABC transporter substrate-binding protein [Desulfurivibrio sp.]